MSRALSESREARGWTQSELAGAAGVSTRTVIRVENGALPSKESAQRLSQALGFESEDLFTEISENGAPTGEPAGECRRCGQPLRPGDRGDSHPTRVCVVNLQRRVGELSAMLEQDDSLIAHGESS